MELLTTAAKYAEFAAREAHGESPTYERLVPAVSRDAELLALLDALPPTKRQPNQLFAVVRFLGGPVEHPAAFHEFLLANWPAIEAEMRARATQTNEAGRCAVLLPVLTAKPPPVDTSGDAPVRQTHHTMLHEGHWTAVRPPRRRYGMRHRDGRTFGPTPPTRTQPTPTTTTRVGNPTRPRDEPTPVAQLPRVVRPCVSSDR